MRGDWEWAAGESLRAKASNRPLRLHSSHRGPPGFIWSVSRNVRSGSRTGCMLLGLSQRKCLCNADQQLQTSRKILKIFEIWKMKDFVKWLGKQFRVKQGEKNAAAQDWFPCKNWQSKYPPINLSCVYYHFSTSHQAVPGIGRHMSQYMQYSQTPHFTSIQLKRIWVDYVPIKIMQWSRCNFVVFGVIHADTLKMSSNIKNFR